ncbi:MAG: EAL domain-containing protein [Gammaproteobacteria bacterium]|jgi:diguanylate cyclase (GGDEF)-like protein/PAS domain S-box-containing protein|nr:EAL domain-containing protein [Gammaproteobacteria bacterium]MBT5053554.1 EAL domain-containing protein [Gammaproteobacteria bacterium]
MSRVFIVEDEVLVARDIKSRLEKLGYQVIGTAARGDDAVTRVLSERPDLILMDINLKGDMDGIEAADRIRAEADLPIIFCTAYSNDETLARAKVTVPYGYVLKPFDNRELEITIEIALHKHQMEVALKAAGIRLEATLQNLDDGVLTIDETGVILLANPMAVQLLGLSKDMLMSLNAEAVLRFEPLNATDTTIDIAALLQGQMALPVSFDRQVLLRQDQDPLPVAVGLNWFSPGGSPLLVISLRDLTTQIAQEVQLVKTAFYDDLTSLPNRQLFLDRLTTRLISTRANDGLDPTPFAVVIISVEGLDVINQALGFSAGDHAIVDVARRIQKIARPDDTLSHLGGGRFALLLSDGGDPGLTLEAVEKAQISIHANIEWTLDATVTVDSYCGLVFGPGEYVAANDMVRDGETAVGRAKSEGLAAVVFDVAMYEKAKAMLLMRSKLKDAIDQRVLLPYFQPIVDLKTLKIISFEALVRWPLSDDVFIPPDDFIPLAEKSGLVLLLGDLMLETVCQQLKVFNSKAIDGFSIAVNISSEQFTEALVDRLDYLISKYDLLPQQIGLEITESVAMKAIDSNLKLLEIFRERGHKISVDDFGTGYSSLAYLKRFPLDTIKIDRAFIQELAVDTDDFIIAKAIIDLGHSLGLKIVAEGVETQAQMKLLQELGCDLGQGFYFQKASTGEMISSCYERGLPLGRAQTL